MTDDKLKTVQISGSPFERGKEYGTKLTNRIGEFVEYLLGEFAEEDTSEEDILGHTRKYLPFIEDYSPEISKELEGVAEGSGRREEEIALISLHEERSAFSKLAGECTTFAATGEATVDGNTYSGQTWDITPGLCSNADPFLLRVRRDEGPDFLSYTYPGMMAGAGLNDSGIGLSWNSVPRLDIDYGVPTYVIIESVLRQDKIGDAISAVLSADRAGCFNFVISGQSEIYSIEATPDDAEIIYSRKTIGHANHYVTEKFRYEQDINQAGGRASASSIIRHNRVNRLLEENEGEIDEEVLMDITKDHVNFPQSICRHPEPVPEGEQGYYSCATWVMDNTNRKWWIASGPGCEHEFTEYYRA
ncbi:MAG: C45 family autoproteolytic acyltransferase/hydrolase [Candidatus Bipolaricaulota bacterium]